MTERAKYWQPIVADWVASGLSQAEYCRQRDIKVFNFRWWKRRLSARKVPNRRLAKPPSKRARYSAQFFVEVKMTDPALSTSYEVVLSGGRVLRLPWAFDAEAVTRLITAVEAVC